MHKINNSKAIKIVIIIVAVILLGLLLVVAIKRNNEQENVDSTIDTVETSTDTVDEFADTEEEGEYILLIPRDDVYSFSMTDAQGIILNFQKQDDKWVYVDNESVDINQDEINSVLDYITGIKFTEVINTDDGSEYGLDQDSPMFVITDANDNSVIISVGYMDDEVGMVYYALNYDFTHIYVNKGNLYNVCAYKIQDLIE